MGTKSSQGGFMVLTAILIAGAVAIAVAASLLILGVISAQTSLSSEQSYQAMAMTDYCAEAGLKQIYNNLSYSGTTTINDIPISGGLTGSCSYAVSGAAPTMTIKTCGRVGNIKRYVQITTNQITPKITYPSGGWVEGTPTSPPSC